MPGSKRAKWAAVGGLAVTVVAALAVGFAFGSTTAPSDVSPGPVGRVASQPAEFLYLDAPRIVSYLSQLEPGLVSTQQLTRLQEASAGAEIGVPSAKLSGTVHRTGSLTVTYAPTVTSRFGDLLHDLRSSQPPSCAGRPHRDRYNACWVTDIKRCKTQDLEHVSPGSLVMLERCPLGLPKYAFYYYRYFQFGFRNIFLPRQPPRVGRIPIADAEKRFIRGVPVHPRVPFFIRKGSVRVLVPVPLAGVSRDAAIFSGRARAIQPQVTILGKLVFVTTEDGKPAPLPAGHPQATPRRSTHPPELRPENCRGRQRYLWAEPIANFEPALLKAPVFAHALYPGFPFRLRPAAAIRAELRRQQVAFLRQCVFAWPRPVYMFLPLAIYI